MNRFKIPIGDWSKDGHSQCDIVIIDCSHTVDEVRKGYKDSCKLTGISFNSGDDYTELNLGWMEARDRQIAAEYENNQISHLAEDVLKKHGIDPFDGFTYDREENEKIYIDGSDHFIELLMKFIKISIPNLEYSFVKDEIPYLNGFWNKDLNVQFGYGLFS